MPFYETGWFIAIFAVAGALMGFGLLGGIGYFVYTKWKESNALAENRQENSSMEMRSSSGRRFNFKIRTNFINQT